MTARLTRWQPGELMLVLVLVLPLVSWLRLATTSADVALFQSPYLVYSVGMLLILAGWIGQDDGWLGLFVGWHVLALLWTPTVEAFETAELLSLSALALCAVRRLPVARRTLARRLLLAMGAFEAVYSLVQMLGYDPLWHGLRPILPIERALGTLGGSDFVGLYLGLLTPLAPFWLVPVFALGLVLSKSLTGLVAAVAGLCWQDPARRRGWLLAGVLVGAGVIWWRGPQWAASGFARVEIWQFGVARLQGWDWLIGHGPGSWAAEIAPAPAARQQWGLLLHAHHDWLQVVYETGLVGLALVFGWLWRWRAAFQGPYGGALVALAVASLAMFGFRVATTGSVIVLLLGAATAEEQARNQLIPRRELGMS